MDMDSVKTAHICCDRNTIGLDIESVCMFREVSYIQFARTRASQFNPSTAVVICYCVQLLLMSRLLFHAS